MEDYITALPEDEQTTYRELSRKVKEIESIDERKKYITKLVILREKAKVAWHKQGEGQIE